MPFSFELQTELKQSLWDADNGTEVHVVVLRGAGRAFSAGYDLTPLAGGRAGRDETYTKVYPLQLPFDDDAWQLERRASAADEIMLATEGWHWLAVVAFLSSSASPGFGKGGFRVPRRVEGDLFEGGD